MKVSKEIDRISPQTIYMGYHTDPYQPCEAECLQTRNVLELLLQKGVSASILTKSDLVVRDIDILKEMKDAAVSISAVFRDNAVRRLFEANTMDTEKRASIEFEYSCVAEKRKVTGKRNPVDVKNCKMEHVPG